MKKIKTKNTKKITSHKKISLKPVSNKTLSNKHLSKKALLKKSPSKDTKVFLHDILFKETFSKPMYAVDIFRLVFNEQEFKLFNWKTLKSELNTFIDKEHREKRTDLQFSVQLKSSQKPVKLLFLLEHKSRQDSKMLTQMLHYQLGMYSRFNYPVIPILVYQGKAKKWNGPLEFHNSLDNFTSHLRQRFGKNVLNFTCRLLNIQALDFQKRASNLTSRPVLFILKHIWDLDEQKVEKLFVLSRGLSKKRRQFLIDRAVDYIRRYDPSFNWKVFVDIESKVIKEEERVMPPLQISLDEARKEGRQEGRQSERQQVILNMLKNKLDTHIICKVTGLSKAEIKKIQKKYS